MTTVASGILVIISSLGGILAYHFPNNNRYFPDYIVQTAAPVFIWDHFTSFHTNIWGDNSDGNIATQDGHLMLAPGKQIWLLYRLSYGTAEFRDVTWGAIPSTDEDKVFGFGDPAEGEFVGFRLDQGTAHLTAEVRHLGQIWRAVIPWNPEYEKPGCRYFVQWDAGKADFYILTPTSSKMVASVQGSVVPDIRLEISVWNRVGTGDIRIGVVKYDKRS